jgi:hypothetical protein
MNLSSFGSPVELPQKQTLSIDPVEKRTFDLDDVGDGEKMRDTEPVARRHLIALLFDLYGAHG